ncbi:hypothetical protein C6503_00010 [Candidatus Poribacteria bacterium]|nr:MAG: hypothetical protein C6503_00010 [Candidatus Poribacteria bacterium]
MGETRHPLFGDGMRRGVFAWVFLQGLPTLIGNPSTAKCPTHIHHKCQNSLQITYNRTIGVNFGKNNPRGPQTGRCGLQPHRILGRNLASARMSLEFLRWQFALS